MKQNRARAIVQNALKQLMEDLEAGNSDTLLNYLSAMARFHRYSVGNVLLISMQKPEAQHVAGFHAWRKLGRNVKKGEKGIMIMAPIIWRKKIVENEEEKVVAFKTAYVFDVSQTRGKPLPEFAKMAGEPGQYLHNLKQFLVERGIQLEYFHSVGSMEGYSTGKRIGIRNHLSPAEEFSTLVHESAHQMLHKNDRSKEKKVIETEAEAVAFVVSQAIGLETNKASSDYIQLYDGKKETLLDSLECIQATASMILDAVTKKQQRETPILVGTPRIKPTIAVA